jgi:hypothetical protein
VTGNVLVVIELEPNPIDLVGDNDFYKWRASKDEHQDWKDHYDDINHIVDMGLSFTLTNNSQSYDAYGEIWISKDSTFQNAAAVKAGAIRIFSRLGVGAGKSTHITWSQSYQYLEHFDELKQYALDGYFWVYATCVSDDLNVTFKKPAVILSVNGKP